MLRAQAGTSVSGVLRIKHSWRLVRDLVGFVVVNRTWWVLPIVVVVAIMSLAVTAANSALPYAVYTLF